MLARITGIQQIIPFLSRLIIVMWLILKSLLVAVRSEELIFEDIGRAEQGWGPGGVGDWRTGLNQDKIIKKKTPERCIACRYSCRSVDINS